MLILHASNQILPTYSNVSPGFKTATHIILSSNENRSRNQCWVSRRGLHNIGKMKMQCNEWLLRFLGMHNKESICSFIFIACQNRVKYVNYLRSFHWKEDGLRKFQLLSQTNKHYVLCLNFQLTINIFKLN